MSVSVVIPAYNEGKNIGATVLALRAAPAVREIIVVDDASVDETGSKAREAGAIVITMAQNVGKGQAVMAAFPFINHDLVLLLDADLKESAHLALALVRPVLENKADLTVAKFSKEQRKTGFGMVKNISRLATRILTGKLFEAPLSGQRCLKKQALAALFPLADRFGLEVGMNIDAVRLGFRIVEVDTGLSHCPPGRDWSGFVHRGAQFWDVLQVLSAKIHREKVT